MSVVTMINQRFGRESLPSFSPLQNEDMLRYQLYRTYFEFYAGRQHNHERADDEDLLTINLCEAMVDKHTAFLAGRGWYLTSDSNETSTPLLKYVNEVWESNNKDILFYEMAHNGSLFGDTYLYIMENADKELRMSNIPPVFVRPRFHPDDKDMLVSAVIEYPVYSDERSEPYVVSIVVDANKASKYINGSWQDTSYHLLGRPPLIHIKNRPFPSQSFGKSDLYSLIELQKHFNAKMTDISDIIAYHSSPITIIKGARLSMLEKGANKMISGLPAEADVTNLEMKGNLEAAMAHLKEVKSLVHQLGGAPEIAFGSIGDMKFSNSSGLAIQMLYQPMIDVLRVKHMYYARGIEEANYIIAKWGERRLELLAPQKRNDKKHYRTKVNFRDPLPRDKVALLEEIDRRLKNGTMYPEDAIRRLEDADVLEYLKKCEEAIAKKVNFAYRLLEMQAEKPEPAAPGASKGGSKGSPASGANPKAVGQSEQANKSKSTGQKEKKTNG